MFMFLKPKIHPILFSSALLGAGDSLSLKVC